ncbi:MAG TPA: hypothetical protein VF487_20940 [Chitinophagaceae bacterium]
MKIEERKLRFFLMCVLLLLSPALYSQQEYNVTSLSSYILDMEGQKYAGAEKIPFKNIIVKDYRFDSTKLGFIHAFGGHNKIKFSSSSSNSFTNYLNKYFENNFDNTSGKSLLIVLKNYWFEQPERPIEEDPKLEDVNPDNVIFALCHTDMEVFCGKDDIYKALIKIKHRFSIPVNKRKELADNIFLPFDSLIKRISTLDIEIVLKDKKEFTISDISNNYMKRFDLPLLKNKADTKGVYITFWDFIQNKPSHTDFKIKKTKLSDELYIRVNNSDELLTEFWGFFDGKDYYIRMGYNFFRLVRQNNTFDLYGGTTIKTDYINLNTQQNPAILRSRELSLTPLQINMETGKIY